MAEPADSDRGNEQSTRVSRRALVAGGLAAAPALLALRQANNPEAAQAVSHAGMSHDMPMDSMTTAGDSDGAHTSGHFAHADFAPGSVDHAANGFDPSEMVRDFDWGRTSPLPGGGTLREWDLIAADKTIEVAPGVFYEAWTYNGRVPGPTLRANQGDRLKIHFINGSAHPHTIHFHGIHPAFMDGMPGVGEERGGGLIQPGEGFTYEFEAEPFGLHLYHCHVPPLAAHITRGLYGAFIVDPPGGRPPADELVMVMNGFDTNFDRSNEIYAVNTVGFHYVNQPIEVKRDELVRIYVANLLEYDLINSFHIHANFFQHFPTGTSLEPVELTDTIIQGQGQRAVLELRFPHSGLFMFHAHISEFTELGWTGFFRVVG